MPKQLLLCCLWQALQLSALRICTSPFADFYDIPYISYRDAFSGKSYFANLTNDTVHPNVVGHHLTAMLLEKLLYRGLQEY